MKKIGALFVLIISIFSLSGCSLLEINQTTETKEPTEIKVIDILEFQSHITNVIEKVGNAAVGVRNITKDGSGSVGSGVIYSREYHESLTGGYYTYKLVTNHHVIKNFSSLSVFLGDNNYLVATYLGSNEDLDIAVLSFISKDMYNYCEFATNTNLKKGQFVIAIGCPLGFEQFNSTSLGIISNFDNRNGLIQHDAAINPGNSGGGLFDLDGKIVGINVSKVVETSSGVIVEGLGYAINCNEVVKEIDRIEKNPSSEAKPTLGITVVSVENYKKLLEMGEYDYKLHSSIISGAVIVGIKDNSYASKGGFKVYDVVISVNDVKINDLEEFTAEFNKIKMNSQATFSVNRNGDIVDITITFD